MIGGAVAEGCGILGAVYDLNANVRQKVLALLRGTHALLRKLNFKLAVLVARATGQTHRLKYKGAGAITLPSPVIPTTLGTVERPPPTVQGLDQRLTAFESTFASIVEEQRRQPDEMSAMERDLRTWVKTKDKRLRVASAVLLLVGLAMQTCANTLFAGTGS
jgi:hypothetical protein